MQKNLLRASVASIAILMAVPCAFAQENAQNTENLVKINQETSDADKKSGDEVVSTGTRMQGGAGVESALVMTITAEDIKLKGLSSIEDIIRSIPQNFNGTDSFSSGSNGARLSREGFSVKSGVSTINLRGVGSAATLVLVNGRRIAGAAGQAGQASGFANISNIPAAAIERVEILLSGASSVYGADAIGGAVNFILKKNYSGLSANVRREISSTGANRSNMSLYGGHGWGTGSISGTVAYSKTDPVISSKAGYTTNDYRKLYDENRKKLLSRGNPLLGPITGTPSFLRNLYDLRTSGISQQFIPSNGLLETGFVFDAGQSPSPFSSGSFLPDNSTGVGADPSDFISEFSPTFAFASPDVIPKFLGSEIITKSVNLNLEQTLTESLNFRGDFLFSTAENNSQSPISDQNFLVPTSNAFNPFGRDVFVQYTADLEGRSGLIAPNTGKSETESLIFNAGFDYDITDKVQLRANYGRSQQSNAFQSNRFTGNVGSVATAAKGSQKACIDKVTNILANSDATQTVNLFGNGLAQTDLISQFNCLRTSQKDVAKTNVFDAYVSGQAFDFPGGEINYVVGGSLRTETLNTIKDKKRTAKALFGEITIPLIGNDNAFSGAQGLVLDLKGRYEKFTISGKQKNLPEFSNFSPYVGLAWHPIDDLKIRGSWSKSFRAPLFKDLVASEVFIDFEDIADFLGPNGLEQVEVELFKVSNPKLKAERGVQYNLGFDWQPSFIEGLTVRADYANLSYKDRIVNTFDIEDLVPLGEYLAIPEIFVRDADGELFRQNDLNLNIDSRESETLDVYASYELDTNSAGTFMPEIQYSKVIKLHDRLLPNSNALDLVGTARGLDRYTLNGGLSWWKDNVSARVGVNYTPSYFNNELVQHALGVDFATFTASDQIQGTFGDVDDYTTVDFSMSYALDNGVKLRAGGRNILNTEFPLAITSSGPFDSTRVNLRGRVMYIDITFEM